MKLIVRIYFILLSVALNCLAQWSDVTSDPVNHFKGFYEMSDVVKILKLEVDINNDGLKEIFLAPVQADDEGNGESWLVYIGKPNGNYMLAGQRTETGINPNVGVGFKRDQYKVGWIPEINAYGLLHLVCGRGGQALCQLRAIVIDGDAWKEIPIGEPVNAEQNYDQLAERFTTPPTPAVQELNP